MRIACVGDVHGSRRWEEVKNLSVDHIVFVGDLVDSKVYDNEQVMSVFEDILEFKVNNETRVKLLLGNHDVQYLYFPDYRCSGFRSDVQASLTQEYRSHRTFFDLGASFGPYLFSHAGISATWLKEFQLFNRFSNMDNHGIVKTLNSWLRNGEHLEQLFVAGRARGGSAAHGGPIWCDYFLELIHDPLLRVNQVFGHTQVDQLISTSLPGGERLLNVNYLAYTDHPIYVLEV